jgi:transposase
MAGEFWLSDRAWAAIEPLLPKNQPGARRVDDRRVISGIIHVLRSGCRWQDCPVAAMKVESAPDMIARALDEVGGIERAAIETGRMSPAICHGLRALGVPVVCIDARRAHQSLKALKANRTDPQDAAGLLYEAANPILTRSRGSFALKTWAQKVAKRRGPRKARVALARRLAVIMHAMLRDGTLFEA